MGSSGPWHTLFPLPGTAEHLPPSLSEHLLILQACASNQAPARYSRARPPSRLCSLALFVCPAFPSLLCCLEHSSKSVLPFIRCFSLQLFIRGVESFHIDIFIGESAAWLFFKSAWSFFRIDSCAFSIFFLIPSCIASSASSIQPSEVCGELRPRHFSRLSPTMAFPMLPPFFDWVSIWLRPGSPEA